MNIMNGKVRPTMLMDGAKTTEDLMFLVRALSKSFNKPNINYFNSQAIINEMKGKNFNTAYQIVKNHFGEFVNFIDKLPENFIRT
jgi:hypothetical protein